ncbi:SsgA family sporulation/cell division regulator [Streptomyces spiramenti]|uniref:SsgA family sporulation/cell division regulator n=1 Tax=Streptomyces spiramenti TaxID=2720606 RepID=A0ABX1AUT5_9ACTN|nr:SsgA family sporulation/cell division regulator [Streptomyces spiramenti]
MHAMTVQRELELDLVLSPGRSLAVPARLVYRSDDPFAVHLTFHVGSHAPVLWTFARELMVEGCFRPAGHGDVRVWPTLSAGRNVVCMALSSPDGEALLMAPALPVSAWLERTLRAVPPGTEHERMGMDEELTGLFAAAPGDDLYLSDPWPSDESSGDTA